MGHHGAGISAECRLADCEIVGGGEAILCCVFQRALRSGVGCWGCRQGFTFGPWPLGFLVNNRDQS